jgi:hypothetical protein
LGIKLLSGDHGPQAIEISVNVSGNNFHN